MTKYLSRHLIAYLFDCLSYQQKVNLAWDFEFRNNIKDLWKNGYDFYESLNECPKCENNDLKIEKLEKEIEDLKCNKQYFERQFRTIQHLIYENMKD